MQINSSTKHIEIDNLIVKTDFLEDIKLLKPSFDKWRKVPYFYTFFV